MSHKPPMLRDARNLLLSTGSRVRRGKYVIYVDESKFKEAMDIISAEIERQETPPTNRNYAAVLEFLLNADAGNAVLDSLQSILYRIQNLQVRAEREGKIQEAVKILSNYTVDPKQATTSAQILLVDWISAKNLGKALALLKGELP